MGRGLYLISETAFASEVFHTCYLYFKKKAWNKIKKHTLAAKCHHISGPLASFRLKNTCGGALISLDLLKVTLLNISFIYIFKMSLYLGGLNAEPLLCILMGFYIGGLYLKFYDN